MAISTRCLRMLDEIKQQKRRENLIAFADKADLTRELVTLKNDVPLATVSTTSTLEPTDGPRLVAFLKAMEFNSLTRRVAEATGTDAAAIEPASVDVDTGAMRGPDLDAAAGATIGGQSDAPGSRAPAAEADDGALTPSALAAARREQATGEAFDLSAYECVRDEARLGAWVDMIVETGLVAVDTETTSLDPMQAELVGISLVDRARQGLLRPARPQERHRRPSGRRPDRGSDRRRQGPRYPETRARGSGDPEDRPELQI